MTFVKNFLKVIILVAFFAGIAYFCYYLTDIKVRQDLKKQCQGETCPCFYNIVDYRLTKDQAVTFLRYLKSRQVRPETKILEFTDLETAFEISKLFGVCQPEQMSELSDLKKEGPETSDEEESTESEEKIEKGEE